MALEAPTQIYPLDIYIYIFERLTPFRRPQKRIAAMREAVTFASVPKLLKIHFEWGEGFEVKK